MDIGIPLEHSNLERRVALAPAGVRCLVKAGHRVFVERSAGAASRFTDDEYIAEGADLAYDTEEVYGRAELVLKVEAPSPSEYRLLRERQILMCFLVPQVAPREGFQALLDRRISAVAMELIEDAAGRAPVLEAMSEIAGPMSVHLAAHLLESQSGGRGILLGGAPGIAPADVVILGAGVVGTTAARTALGNLARVTVLDRDVARLRRVYDRFGRQATTLMADDYSVTRVVRRADALIGAILIRGDRTPHLVTEAMVRSMKSGSVIIDVSIDQGGCVETSRPTTLLDPTYVHEDVVHYAVPNMTSNVARAATQALSNAALHYVLEIAGRGLPAACEDDPGLLAGLVTWEGSCLHPRIARRFQVEPGDPSRVVGARGGSDAAP